jgi:hypothetical protein
MINWGGINMTNEERLRRLNELLEVPQIKNRTGFGSQSDCIKWLDMVAPLVRIDDEFYAEFVSSSKFLKAYGLSQASYENQLEKALSAARRTAISLAAGHYDEPQPPPAEKPPLLPPDKVTLEWLWRFVPWPLWGSLLSIIGAIAASAFGAGIWLAQTDLYKSLTSATPSAASATTNAPMTNDPKKSATETSKTKSAPTTK